MIDVRVYLDRGGRSPFGAWLEALNAEAAAKVNVAMARLGQGIMSNVKSVGLGVHEYRINFGPGYRVYFGIDGEALVILLGAAPRSGSSVTLRWPCNAGRITNSGNEGCLDATDTIL